MRSTVHRIIAPLIVLVFALSSCEVDTKGESAIVSEAESVLQIPADAKIFHLDTSASMVTWIGTKPTGKHNGTIAISEGSLAISDEGIIGGTVMMNLNKIDVIDLRDDPSDYDRLINHLKSDDFFDVTNHPDARFDLLEVTNYNDVEEVPEQQNSAGEFVPESAGEHRVQNPTHWIKGNLTLRGSTFAIKFPAKVEITSSIIVAEAKFNIDRTQWGLVYKNEGDIRDKAKDSFIFNTVNTGFILKATITPSS